jgi:hypothetical protein
MRATTGARLIPAAANTSGNSPQAIPSFRLLTSPAWLTLDRFASTTLVRQKISRAVGTGSGDRLPTRADSCETW